MLETCSMRAGRLTGWEEQMTIDWWMTIRGPQNTKYHYHLLRTNYKGKVMPYALKTTRIRRKTWVRGGQHTALPGWASTVVVVSTCWVWTERKDRLNRPPDLLATPCLFVHPTHVRVHDPSFGIVNVFEDLEVLLCIYSPLLSTSSILYNHDAKIRNDACSSPHASRLIIDFPLLYSML